MAKLYIFYVELLQVISLLVLEAELLLLFDFVG